MISISLVKANLTRTMVFTKFGRYSLAGKSSARSASEGLYKLIIDFVLFITRRQDILPPVVRLTPEWGAAAFMLGESVETSAGDPTQAGKQLRVVGTNPFIVGSEEEEGNTFLSGVDRGQKITVRDSVKMVEMIARDEITWKKDDFWGYEVPVGIPGEDLSRFDLGSFYTEEQIKELSEELKRERLEWLSQFPRLDKDIFNAIKS